MYNQFFGLVKDPFNMTPDPEFLYLTPQHREALAGLTYAVLGRKGFVVLAGDAGTGKTTLLARALQHFSPAQVQTSVIVNSTLTSSEFLEATLLDFGFRNVPASKALRISAFLNFLLKSQQEGKISALIVDEAHKLSLEVLEEIRLLGNLESTDKKMLQIVLLGQSELDGLLDSEQLRQFKQRIALRLSIEALSETDVEPYMRHRWRKAGGGVWPFSVEAVQVVSQMSQGIPRIINVICDNSLLQAFGDGSISVEARHVRGACTDLRLFPSNSSRQDTIAVPGPTLAHDPTLAPGPAFLSGCSIKTLERYSIPGRKPSLLARFAGKIGLAQRTEIA